ncbi:protein-L-isoaspartate O-methyltransferase [Patescibacteria group bacterium]|nr:protein-L-isoaspartate O-methyltransferase [Patescibacteria group bacterium]MBU4162089.1 protein-L-isoaspartate O-methyltransferase [Patescibacteria group bacterium]
MSLINDLIKQGWLKTPEIIKAFQAINRKDFLGDDYKEMAEVNEALPIGLGQTISQPLVVAFMLEKLEPKSGHKILDIGSGSGWTSALLAHIVGDKGKVIGIEIIPELKEFGERNARKYGFIEQDKLEFIIGDGRKGYPQEAPFDRILCSASAESVPSAWGEQVEINSKIVMPINNSICVFTKKANGSFEKQEYQGFVFVPLVKK